MYWILAIFAGVCLIVIIFTVPETYAPAILVTKARRLRKETGEERWYAPRKLIPLISRQAKLTACHSGERIPPQHETATKQHSPQTIHYVG